VVDIAKPTYARRHAAPPAARRALNALRAEDRGEISAEQRQAVLDEIAEQLADELELPFDPEGGDE
jgi:hypothetical protein